MRIYALSDLHLQSPVEAFLFTHEKEATFVRVAAEALETGATLLLAGDVFDLTGMSPPARGLPAFFARLRLPVVVAPEGTDDPASQLRALQATFPGFFAALAPLARAGRLQLLLGNHDCALGTPGGKAALAAALELEPGKLALQTLFRAGDFLFACHGNQYDASNGTAGGCGNRGAVFTSALYHGVIPALRALQVREDIASAVPSVRPEENVVVGIELYLGKAQTKQLLLAFVELLLVNGYFAGLDAPKMWLATHLLPFLLSGARVRKALADDARLKDVTRAHAQAILQGSELPDGVSTRPRVVVMGHTHELDATADYVNLGTWIDHLAGLAPENLVVVDRTLPVLVVDGDQAVQVDCRALAGPVTEAAVLWRRR